MEITNECQNAVARKLREYQKSIGVFCEIKDVFKRHGWVELPVDADGEPIHVGDMMERGKAHGCVIALMLSNYPNKWGGGLHWAIQLEGEQAPTALDNLFHHYKPPTVEDVLREFTHAILNQKADYREQNIAEYAAKLRLAGEAE